MKRKLTKEGRWLVRLGPQKWQPLARYLAEKALRNPLPNGAQVHHVNGKPSDDRPGNLVLCQNPIYHRLLEERGKALRATGDWTHKKCHICKNYGPPTMVKKRYSRRGGKPTAYLTHITCHLERRTDGL